MTNSADPDQTAPKEQSDQDPALFDTRVLFVYSGCRR